MTLSIASSRHLAAAVVSAFFMVLTHEPASACSCRLPATSERVGASAAVFVGTFVSATPLDDRTELWEVEVWAAWKGVRQRRVQIRAPRRDLPESRGGAGRCSSGGFTPGDYLVYANRRDGVLTASLGGCSWTESPASVPADMGRPEWVRTPPGVIRRAARRYANGRCAGQNFRITIVGGVVRERTFERFGTNCDNGVYSWFPRYSFFNGTVERRNGRLVIDIR